MSHLIDADDRKVVDPGYGQRERPKDLRLLEILIDKTIKRLEENSCEPKIQDALKAILLKQKVAKTSEAEQTFWQLIEDIKSEVPEPIDPNRLEAQILKTILGLKDQVKNGILPVKTITDTFNQEKLKESQSPDSKFQLTYPRIGRILSTMGFRKAKTGSGASAIIWDEDFIFSLCPSLKYNEIQSASWDDSKQIKPSSEPSERSEPSETPEAKENPSVLKKDRQDASPGQVENPARGGVEVNTKLFLCPPDVWSHRH
jgi:hypothetical protein